MYVAPLNFDLFFKKVFSNKRVAKKFLEDLLNVTITEIKFLSVENKMTDDSVVVKFDFRCKIHGQYVVIEMQQNYKIDVVKRFYLYQAVSTALQLETLKPDIITKPNGETYTEKNYSGLEPVITLIWMVNDMLGFDEDFIAYTTLPETAKEFISDRNLWEQPLEKILEEREKVIKILENKTKELDFFSKNRMIYVFQKNIVKNKRVDLPYYKWFDIANMSRNPNNTEEDFSNYKNDKDMAEVINRIRKDKLLPEEFKYMSDLFLQENYTEKLRYDYESKMASQKEQAELKIEQAELKIEQAELKAEQEKQKNKFLQLKLAESLLTQGQTIPAIAEALDISIQETTELIEIIQNR
jgi:Icc-related predicted phosphoesterase